MVPARLCVSEAANAEPRRFLACDRCGVGAWVGPDGDRFDAWCECCQRAASFPTTLVSRDLVAPRCESCGEPMTLGAPRFEELFGEIQNLVAVLEAWTGDPRRLRPLVPERPRFLADLDAPESRAGDPPALGAALAALRSGAFGDARERLEAMRDGSSFDLRAWVALGIAHQRLGDLAAAEDAFARALDREPLDARARLDRAALRARRGDFEGARSDVAHAGDGAEARWNRAALRVLEAVAAGTGLPEPERLAEARAEAGPPSPYWSDPTVGRLLFALLVERAHARGASACGDARTLRAAEGELEFETFDDRSLALLGYASLELADEVERVAAPLAAALVVGLSREPFARGPSGRFLAAALETVASETSAGRPRQALAAATPLLARSDLRRYRIPCARCAQGSVGVERVEEEPAARDTERGAETGRS